MAHHVDALLDWNVMFGFVINSLAALCDVCTVCGKKVPL